MIIAYQRLIKDIEIIEATSYESETLERLVYQMDVRKVSSNAIEQVEFFNQIVCKISEIGLDDLQPDIQPDSDEVSIEALMTFITE